MKRTINPPTTARGNTHNEERGQVGRYTYQVEDPRCDTDADEKLLNPSGAEEDEAPGFWLFVFIIAVLMVWAMVASWQRSDREDKAREAHPEQFQTPSE